MKKYLFSVLFLGVMMLGVGDVFGQGGIISTVAGNGIHNYSGDGGAATAAELNEPMGVAVDSAGNIYIADFSNTIVRKVSTSGVITTFAGNYLFDTLIGGGYSGDGGPATAAQLSLPVGITADGAGNIYIVDVPNAVIRKVNTSGIISTIAGNYSLGTGYSGDGGPATAAQLANPNSVVVDGFGNVYIADVTNNVIRKVNTSGIISTIVGNYLLGAGYSGDGGYGTAAQLNLPNCVAMDGIGNIYIADEGNNVIRKVSTSGIISTIVGNHSLDTGYGGDGGLAIAAQLRSPISVAVDAAGNIYFVDYYNNVIRAVNAASGIISTVAGNHYLAAGYSGDGGMATAAKLYYATAVTTDLLGNIYIADQTNNRIRKVTHAFEFTHSADSFSEYIDAYCGGPQFTMVTKEYSAALSIKTYFGDGAIDTSFFTEYAGASGYAIFTHNYVVPGNYTIKSLLMNDATVIDSMSYTYDCMLCNNIPVKFYNDMNNDCVYDSGDYNIYLPALTEVDSNGVAIDTISATGGFYYTAYGAPGDIYSFKIISLSVGLVASCPSTGIITDTLQSIAYTVPTEFMALQCAAGDSFDLAVNASLICGRHSAKGDIIVNNTYCNPEDAALTMHFSPKYIFNDAYPVPSSVSGNTVVWNMSALSSVIGTPVDINFEFTVPGAWLTIGDTVNSNYKVTPYAGDIDTLNNFEVLVDTITSSFDPNNMSVQPQGYIDAGTQLQYTINFTNTGNDTAFNIYVMDTLSDNVDVHSLRLVTASNVMNIAMLKSGGHNIVKFDFPGINLLDSVDHPNQCSGAVIFNVNVKKGLANGTTIFNHAGVFFDDNPVVVTDTVEDIIGTPANVGNVGSATMWGNVVVYPNPVGDFVNVQICEYANVQMGVVAYNSLTISNTVGEVILQQAITATQTMIDVKSLVAGVYYVTLKGESGVVVRKFVKM